MKKLIAIAALTSMVLCGCFDSSSYHEMDDSDWINQQIENGTIDKNQAEKLKSFNEK
jgi:hypothetical protein